MPTIANPPTPSGLHDLSAGDVGPFRTDGRASRSLAVWLRVLSRRAALTRELAEGAAPTSSPELAMRAAQLTSAGRRRQLGRTLRRTIDEARRPQMTRSRAVIVLRPAVLDAEPAINALIERLRSPQPVSAEGMAIVEQIVSDSEASPLYNPAEPGTLRRRVLVASAALDPSAGRASILA